MFFKHKYLNLSIGLVKENYVVVKRKDKSLWKTRGFKSIHKYPIFHYKPNHSEVIMLGKPTDIMQFGTNNFQSNSILDVSTCCGTYGMGGPGFFGMKLKGNYGTRWLTYCIWNAGEHILFDDRVLECHPDISEKYNPWITEDYLNSTNSLKNLLCEMKIEEVILSDESIRINLIDSSSKSHYLESYKYSEKYPEQVGTGKKRNSYNDGVMKNYWLVTFDASHLMV